MNRISVLLFPLVLIGLFLLLTTGFLLAQEPEKESSPDQPVRLPGIEINVEDRHVDVEAFVCLLDGRLELVVCTEGTKEHESVVMVKAEPIHIHTALLLIGARNGNPAMRKPINEEQTRWMHIPPRGDLIELFLVFQDADGKTVERPISDFIKRAEEDPLMSGYAGAEESRTPAEGEKEKFPNLFVFAGSHLIEDENGQKQYIVKQSGNLVSISTFGDELLCLPIFHSQMNGDLVWEVDPTHLPPVDTKVTLRLRPKTAEKQE